jgi:hypothetical protein
MDSVACNMRLGSKYGKPSIRFALLTHSVNSATPSSFPANGTVRVQALKMHATQYYTPLRKRATGYVGKAEKYGSARYGSKGCTCARSLTTYEVLR